MSLSASESRQIALRYADALFAVAVENKSTDDIGKGLDVITNIVVGNEDIKTAIANPTFSRGQKNALITSIAEKAGSSKEIVNFVGMLAKNNRLNLLPYINESYINMVSESKGETNIEIIVSEKISDKNLASLKKATESALGKKVAASVKEDPSILGGVMIKMGSKILDCSVKGRLDRLESELNEKIING